METERITPLMKVDIKGTLLAIPHGKTVFCPHDVIRDGTVRTMTTRFMHQGEAMFKVETVQGGVNITRK